MFIAKIIKDHDSCRLVVSNNGKQWRNILLEPEIKTAVILRDVLNDFIERGICDEEE